MKLGKVISNCKVRGYISKKSTPQIKYYKNNERTIIERVIEQQKDCILDDDWETFNPESNEFSTTA